jgi:phospholipase C
LGVRVPAILVSPYVGKGQVDHTIYDHTSLIATVKKLFDLPQFLTRRDATANTFEHRIFDSPRVDAPETLLPPGSAPKQVEHSDVMQSMEGFSEFQRSLVKLSTLINTAASPRTKLEGVSLAKDQLAKFFGTKGTDPGRK